MEDRTESFISPHFKEFALSAAVLLGLYFTSLHSYLLFHTIVELFAVVISFGIFTLAWNSRRFMENNYLLFLGIACLFIGFVGLIHALAYKGIGIFRIEGANVPTQLWIASRYLLSGSVLAAPFFLRRRLYYYPVFAGYLTAVSLLLLSIFYWNNFPACYIEGTGLTPFKKTSEYVISAFFLAAVGLLFMRRDELDRNVFRLSVGFIIASICSELVFTLYTSVYGLANLIGHYFHLASFYLIYRAIIVTGLVKPHDLLFRSLKQSEESLRKAHDELQSLNADLTELNQEMETIVAERTMSLMALTVADRVRNPAAIIGWTCRKICERGDIPEKMRDVLRDIISESGNLENIVRNFEALLKSKQSIFRYEYINDSVVAAVSITEKPARDKGVSVSMHLAEHPLKINVQKNLLRVALLQLMRNAIEATPEGGSITVATSKTNESADITISDTGMGISEEDKDKIFDPFFSTKKRRFGMGLPLVKQIVKEHLGEITVESEPGKGTTFRLIFPVRWTERKATSIREAGQ